MTRIACKYENGALWWRGSNPEFVWLHPMVAEHLAEAFAADPEPYAQDYGRQLRAILKAYHTQEIAA